MSGQPVWLASLSFRDKNGQLVCTDRWKDRMRILGKTEKPSFVLQSIIGDLGDDSQERCFRMNVTMCLHRAARESEIESLPAWWHESSAGLAGGPVEVLWSTVPQTESSKPCKNPEHLLVDSQRVDLWVPGDCGECEPCKARQARCVRI